MRGSTPDAPHADAALVVDAPVGVIRLDTHFPRPLGDIGNPQTFGERGLFETVPGATFARVAGPDDPALVAAFAAARDRLVARGAVLITTTCGFLIRHQARLQHGCPVPVVTSSLLQVRDVARTIAPSRLGILVMDGHDVDAGLLSAAGAPTDVAVGGLEGGTELLRVLRADRADDTLDAVAATADVIAAGRALAARTPRLGAIVLECANLPPYRAALSAALGVPVFDILTLIAATLRKRATPTAAFA